MKNTILSIAFLLFTVVVFGQTERTPAQEMTDQLALKYNLTKKQKAEMLTIQERKHRNFSEIENLRKSDPLKFIEKIRALKMGTDASIQRLLTQDQLVVFNQEKVELRKQKAAVNSELRAKGASQSQINYKISELEESALMGSTVDGGR